MLSFHWPMIISCCPIEQIQQYLLLLYQNKVHNCWCWPQNPFKTLWKKYLYLSERERERKKESNKIPWLRGSCGILVLTESSSSLHSAVCFGRLSEVEICSSFHPQLCRNSKQHWSAPRDSRYATSESVISRFHRHAVSADMARLKANYSQRIKPTLRS